MVAYILKAKKFAKPPIQSKKCGSFLGHFGSFLGHFESFWVILGPFGVIFGPLWAILGHFWPFSGHFVAFFDKFVESSNFLAGLLGSQDSILECMKKGFLIFV